MKIKKTLWKNLGDGVHAKSDGFGIILRAHDPKDPTHEFYLEPDVINNLLLEFIKEKKQKEDKYE